MFVDEREGRAGHMTLGGHPHAFCESLNERGLACPERAGQGHHVANGKGLSQARCESLHVGGAADVKS
jgi:hypothetical protein